MDSGIKIARKINPRATINPLYALFFVHLFPIFKKGFKKGIAEDDLYAPLKEHESALLGDKLEAIWVQEMEFHKKTALHRAIIKLLGFDLCMIGVFHLLAEMINLIVIPYAVSGLVTYFASEPIQVTKNEAYVYAGLIIISVLVYCLILHSAMMELTHVAMKARVACCSMVYRKCLRLSHSSLAQTTIGQIVNLLSNDVSKFDNGILLLNYIWVAPIQVVVGTYLLYRAIGVAAFSGMAFLLLFVPLQIYLGKKNSLVRLKTAIRTDERVRLMDEILTGIQAIKMYTWEKPFAKVVSAARRYEIKSIRIHYYLEAIMFSLDIFVSRTCIFISIVIFIILGNQILANIAYTVTLIYGIIRQSVTKFFSFGIARVGEIITTINRLQQFLLLEDLHLNIEEKLTTNEGVGEETMLLVEHKDMVLGEKKYPRIILKSIDARWIAEATEKTLSDVSINITHGQLVAIIGPVGSGKSSIINVILRELPVLKGYIEIDGVISYASQQAWLFAASVRQNILFGSPYDEKRYKTILKVCSLESDLKLLPRGDRTIVGERGSSLSGGQKARINLARCIYKQADIYLLDDPLSAVDAKVGKRLYDDCITKFLNDKICILVTHQLQYLKNTNKIIILNKGKIVGNNHFHELQKSGLDFAKLLQEFSAVHEADNCDKKSRSRQNSELSLSAFDMFEDINDDLSKEKLESGKIKSATYLSYLHAGGSYFVLILLALVFLAAQGAANTGDYFVAYWINIEQDIYTQNEVVKNISEITHNFFDRTKTIYTYTGIIFATIILAISHSVFFFLFFMRASVNIHDWIFNKISHAAMIFFNDNPTGRILNRFSKDIGIIDEYIPFVIIDIVQIFLLLLGTVTVTSIVNPWLLLPLTGLIILFYFLRIVYIETSRNVKRIEGITRSPMFNHVTATIDGLSTIRALTAQHILTKEFDCHQDLHSSAWYLTIASSRGFGFWLDMICTTFISFLTISLIVVSKDAYYGGHIGLILTQYLNLTGILQWGMRMWSELENNMTSVERVLEYTQVETEPVRYLNNPLPNNWPQFGEIIIKNVSLKYKPNDPPVLKNLNFTIRPGEKIGVVGRTGAGKSSIIASLFQLYNIDGSIVIDNIDTTKIPLNCLRSKISIIPQTPVLFSGTMRKNLDPFEEYTDEILWNALDQVELKNDTESFGLNANVLEGGTNFSIGQRQLVCLARAIVKNNKILVMDEATANVDPHTDQLIQKTIREKFAKCTVITIAHRLDTVMDSDKILVMDAGRLIEFDQPYILLNNTNSIFYSMVQTTGIISAHKLKTIAEENYKKALWNSQA